MSEDDDLERFLSHKTSARSQNAYLKGWKDDGEFDGWLHTKQLPEPRWCHNIPTRTSIDVDGKKIAALWGRKYVCPEDEEILKRVHYRDDDGNRKNPPETCGVCKMIEWFYQQAWDGKISWVDEAFEFSGKRKQGKEWEDVTDVLHVGGLYNGFSRLESDEEKEELRKAKIRPSEAWRENMLAKCEYVITVVDDNDVKAGIQIATETGLLGDKIRGVIIDRMKSKGKEKGSIVRFPYCIRWEYREDAKAFHEKYHALALDEAEFTDKIKNLIVDTPPPDIKGMLEPMEQDTVRSMLERACLLKGVPWDKLFPAPRHRRSTTAAEEAEKASARPSRDEEKTKRRTKDDEGDESEELEEKNARRADEATKPAKDWTSPDNPYGLNEDDEDNVALCNGDGCDKVIHVSWNRCPFCKKTYKGKNLVDPPTLEKKAETKEEEPPRRRRRGEAKQDDDQERMNTKSNAEKARRGVKEKKDPDADIPW